MPSCHLRFCMHLLWEHLRQGGGVIFCYTQGYKLFPARKMDLVIPAFQGIPLGGSGGPEKDRMFCFFCLW